MLSVNTLFKYTDETSVYRILWMSKTQVVVIDISSNRVPFTRTKSEIIYDLENLKAELVDTDPYVYKGNREKVKEKYKVKLEQDWELIANLVVQEPHIYHSSYRSKLIKEVAEKSDVKQSFLVHLLKRYWVRGMTKDALRMDYDNCGGRGIERPLSKDGDNTKRGRPRRLQGNGTGKNVTLEDEKIFTISLNRYYYTTAKRSLMKTYEMMKASYFIKDIEEGKPVVTYSQFLYWFNKRKSIKREITSRTSARNFRNNHSPVLGTISNIDQLGCFEIDGTVGDVYLVSEYNKEWYIGRPTVFMLVDRFSHYISGLFVCIDSSYMGNALCIYNMFQNKEDFCKEYGIEDVTEDIWMSGYIPKKIVADRGEIEGKSIENIIEHLGINVQLTPANFPVRKGLIENAWSTMLSSFVNELIDGHTDLSSIERGDVDPRVKGVLTLKQYTQILIKTIIYFNNHHVLENFEPIPEMREDGFTRYIPRDIMNWCSNNIGNPMKRVTKTEMILSLLPSEEVLVNKKGIQFKKMRYTCERYVKEGLFIKAREKSFKVKISFDPRDLKRIYIHNPDIEEGYEVAHVIDEKGRYSHKSIEEIEMLFSKEHQEKITLKNEEEIYKLNLINEIRQISSNAKNEVKSIRNDSSNSLKVRDIKENRRIEKEAFNNKTLLSLPDNSENKLTDEVDENMDELAMFYEALEGDD